MRKLFVFVMVLAMVLTFAACRKDKSDGDTQSDAAGSGESGVEVIIKDDDGSSSELTSSELEELTEDWNNTQFEMTTGSDSSTGSSSGQTTVSDGSSGGSTPSNGSSENDSSSGNNSSAVSLPDYFPGAY